MKFFDYLKKIIKNNKRIVFDGSWVFLFVWGCVFIEWNMCVYFVVDFIVGFGFFWGMFLYVSVFLLLKVGNLVFKVIVFD